MTFPAAEAIAVGKCVEEAEEIVYLILGGRESEDSWKGLLLDLEGRGIERPHRSSGQGGNLRETRSFGP
jgi:hypothetical protein